MNDLLLTHVKILEEAITNNIPQTINKNDRNDFDSIKYLHENNYLDGNYSPMWGGDIYTNLKITDNGKLYLSEIKQQLLNSKLSTKTIKSIPNSIQIVCLFIAGLTGFIFIILQIYDRLIK
jgi:hypothetical protein